MSSTTGGPVAGEPVDLDRIADALEGAGDRLHQRNQHLSDIRDGISALIDSNVALMLAVKGNADRNRQFRWQMLGFAAVVVLGIVTILLVGTANHGLSTQIKSCVDASGQCHKDQLATTAAAVAELETAQSRTVAAAVICARTDTEYDHVLACIQRLVATTP